MAIRRRQVIVVPLLDPEPTREAIDVACRLAAEEHARILLVAPLFVELELPLGARFDEEESVLRSELGRHGAVAERYGVPVEGLMIRTRHGQIGDGVAAAAAEIGADLIVIGARLEGRRGFRWPFSRDVWSVLHDAPCRVLLATGSPLELRRAAA
jgi:nucleotide-binding universal stress UspA family protein